MRFLVIKASWHFATQLTHSALHNEDLSAWFDVNIWGRDIPNIEFTVLD